MYFGIESIGPGRYSATSATTSLMWSGLRRLINSGGMSRCVAIKALDLLNNGKELFHPFVFCGSLLQTRFAIDGFGQRDGFTRRIRNEFGQTIDKAERQLHDAADIAHRRAWL